MSSRRRWIVVLVGGALGLAVAPVLRAGAGAQTQAEYRARVQALVPIREAELRAKAHEDSMRRQAFPTDTVAVTPMTVVADVGVAQLASGAASDAVRALRYRFGAEVDRLEGHLIAVWPGDRSRFMGPTVRVAEANETGAVVRETSSSGTRNSLASDLTGRAARILTGLAPAELRDWLGGAVPVDSSTESSWVGVRIGLATSSSALVHECYTGNIKSCALALGVSGRNDPYAEWLTANERRARVRRAGRNWFGGVRAEYQPCVADGDDDACLALLRSRSNSEIEPPVDRAGRQELMRLAMDLGGAGAYTRVLAAPDTPEAQLAAAAGITVDSLVRLWRARAVDAPIAQTTMTPALAIMSLFWVTACGALALRSSRWR